jgi:hypothetical protein
MSSRPSASNGVTIALSTPPNRPFIALFLPRSVLHDGTATGTAERTRFRPGSELHHFGSQTLFASNEWWIVGGVADCDRRVEVARNVERLDEGSVDRRWDPKDEGAETIVDGGEEDEQRRHRGAGQPEWHRLPRLVEVIPSLVGLGVAGQVCRLGTHRNDQERSIDHGVVDGHLRPQH